MKPEKYQLGDISLFGIRNRNETRVIEFMRRVLAQFPDYAPDPLEIEDIYALALNMLPARYAQAHSFVIRETVSDEMVEHAVREAVIKVRACPKKV